MANLVLSHLTDLAIKESSDLEANILFTENELIIIKYLSGYAFSTLHRRIRKSKLPQSMFGSQSLQILLAGKSEIISSNDNMLTQAKDRGGLWTVTTEVFQIFQFSKGSWQKRSIRTYGHPAFRRNLISSMEECVVILIPS